MPLLSFSVPWLLLLVPLTLLLPRRRNRWLRIVALSLAVIALAGPRLPLDGGSLVVLTDVSASAGEGLPEELRDLDAELLVFAADTMRLPEKGARLPPALDRGQTDIARALQVAAASGAGRILLISDGLQTRGDALANLPSVPVDTLHVPPVENARLEALMLPDTVAPGQQVEGLAVVTTDRATTGSLLVQQDGAALMRLPLDLPAGRSTIAFTVTAPESGTARLDVLAEVGFSQPLQDDSLHFDLAVSEQPAILVIDDPAVAAVLRQAGALVQEGSALDVQAPLDHSALVIRGSASMFSTGQHELLQQYVESGGGLLMTGGPESFGFGGWYRTPLEETLPVVTDLRTEVEIPLVGLIMLVDRSQSMSAGNPSRLELAKEGAIAVVELAYHEDLLGLMAFSDTSEWIFELRPATERGKREMLDSILRLATQGGTILGPAYSEAIAVLAASDAAIRHIIILSDGRLYDGQGPFSTTLADFGQLAASGSAQGITTSTIAIGDNADFEQLSAIAEAGGGRYYEALDASTLPRIFTSEAMVATRSLLREGGIGLTAHPHALSSVQDGQQADAYVATTARPTAEVILEGLEEEPVLALGRFGLGRTAVLTTDLGAWAPGLAADEGFTSTLVRIARWLQLKPASFSVSARPEAAGLRVVVDAVEAGQYINNRQLTAVFAGERTLMEQVAPGRYVATVPAGTEPGTLLVVDGTDIVARHAVSTAGQEFAGSGGGRLLADISSRTGGQVLSSAAGWNPDAGRSFRPVWSWPLAAAILVFLIELALRRLGPASARRTAGKGRSRPAERRTAS